MDIALRRASPVSSPSALASTSAPPAGEFEQRSPRTSSTDPHATLENGTEGRIGSAREAVGPALSRASTGERGMDGSSPSGTEWEPGRAQASSSTPPSSSCVPELTMPGSTSYSSVNQDELINTPQSSWDQWARAAHKNVVSLTDLDDQPGERDQIGLHTAPPTRPDADLKGKGKEMFAGYQTGVSQQGRLPASQASSSTSDVGRVRIGVPTPLALSQSAPLVHSPCSLLPSSPYQSLVDDAPVSTSAATNGRSSVSVARVQTQPTGSRATSASPTPISVPSSIAAVQESAPSTPSRLKSRSRANSLLSFSPAGSVASTSASSSVIGRKLDEIKDKLKLTKLATFTKTRKTQDKDVDDRGASVPNGLRRRGLFGQRRRTIGAFDAPSASTPALADVRGPSPFSGRHESPSLSRPPSPPPAFRSGFRAAHPLALRPIVTRAVTTTSLTTPFHPVAHPIPTPFLLPARSAPASPTLRTVALPFVGSPSNNPSLLSLTRPSTPSPPRPADHFDRMLPREIKVLVFRTLLDVWKSEEHDGIRNSHRWVGEVGGRRELIRISRVSKAWLSLVLDGELWPTLSARPYANLPPGPGASSSSSPTRSSFLPLAASGSTVSIPTATLLAITSRAGPFIRSLDLRNLTTLSSATMHALALAASPVSLGSLRRSFDIGWDGGRELGLDDKDGVTRLTSLDLEGCRSFSGYALHHLLAKSPFLMRVNLRAIPVVTNNTCTVLHTHCPLLVSLNLSRCPNIDAFGVALLTGRASTQIAHLQGGPLPPPRPMKALRLAGLQSIDDDFVDALACGMPLLQILDLSGCKSLTDDHLRSFVTIPPPTADNPHLPVRTVALTSREMGHDPASSTVYYRRLTSLRHVNLSSCSHLTHAGLAHLTHTMPRLEFLEVAGFGPRMRDEGIVKLLETTPGLRKLDLDSATEITDATLGALTPDEDGMGTGSRLEHLVLSYVARVTADGMLRVVRGCKKLRVLEADNTRVSDPVVKDFVRLAASRRTLKAEITVTDSRTVSKAVLTDLHQRLTRPRRGFRGFAALPFQYQDATLDPDVAWGPGRSEIDDTRVVLSSFWGWSLVDAVRVEVAKEKRRKAIIAAAMASFGGEAGPSAPLATMSGGRRLLGWRSSGGSGVVMLDGMQPPTTLVIGGAPGAAGATSPTSPGGGGGGITPATPASMESLMDPRDPRASCVVM